MKIFSKKKILILVLVILLIPAVLIISNYLEIRLPFISKSLDKKITVLVGSIPVIPKTPRQILYTAFYKNSKLDSYNAKISFNLKDQKSNIELGKFDFQGFYQNGDVKVYSLNGKGAFLNQFLMNFETIEVGEDFYFKFTDPPNIFGLDFGNIPPEWYQIKVDQIEKESGVAGRSDTDIQKDIKKFFETSLNEKRRDQLLKKAKKQETKDSYLLSLDLGSTDLKNINNYLEAFASTSIQITVNKKTGYLEKMTGSFVGQKSEKLAFQNENLVYDIKLEMNSFNQKFTPAIPEQVKKINTSLDLFGVANPGRENQASLFDRAQSAQDYSASIITAERLIHVILLAPLSF